MLGELAGGVIAQEAGDRGARTGQDADEVADDPGPQDGRAQDLALFAAEAHLVGELGRLRARLDLFLRQNKDLGHGEQTDQGAGGVDALGEVAARHEALHAGNRVQTDGGDHQAQRAGHQALDDGFGIMDLDETPAMMVRPKMESQKYSADMNFSVSFASSGEKKYSEIQLSRPPQKDA